MQVKFKMFNTQKVIKIWNYERNKIILKERLNLYFSEAKQCKINGMAWKHKLKTKGLYMA